MENKEDKTIKLKAEIFDLQVELSIIRQKIQKRIDEINKLNIGQNKGNGQTILPNNASSEQVSTF